MPDPFLSVGDFGDFVGRDLTADTAAPIALAGACDIVRTLTEQRFDQVSTDTITLDGTGTDSLLLPQLPATAVSAVVEGDTTLTADDDYLLNGNGVLLRLPSLADDWSWVRRTWQMGRQNISVTYSHGYLANEIPNDIRMVALTIATRLLDQGTQGAVIETSESLGAYSTSTRYAANIRASDLTIGERAILHKYRVAK